MASVLSLFPVLPVRDVAIAIEYYSERLGFSEVFRDLPGEPKYAALLRDGIGFHLQWHEPATFRAGVDTASLRFFVDDVDELYGEFQQRGGIPADCEIRDTTWGTREFAFYDPDGNGLFFYRML